MLLAEKLPPEVGPRCRCRCRVGWTWIVSAPFVTVDSERVDAARRRRSASAWTPVGMFIVIVSSPLPPMIASLGPREAMMSLPPPPLRIVRRPPPKPPVIESSPEPPWIVTPGSELLSTM